MTDPTASVPYVVYLGAMQEANRVMEELRAKADKWQSLAVRLAKQHEPYVPMMFNRKQTVSGALLDEIYELDRASKA